MSITNWKDQKWRKLFKFNVNFLSIFRPIFIPHCHCDDDLESKMFKLNNFLHFLLFAINNNLSHMAIFIANINKLFHYTTRTCNHTDNVVRTSNISLGYYEGTSELRQLSVVDILTEIFVFQGPYEPESSNIFFHWFN